MKSEEILKNVSKVIYVLNKVLPVNAAALSPVDLETLHNVKDSIFGVSKVPVTK